MPIFEIEANGKSYEVDAPDQAQALKALGGMKPAPQGFVANAADFVKSIPRGLVQGLTSAPNPSMVPIADEEAAVAPARAQAKETLVAPLPEAQGPAGKFGEAIGEAVGNPVSYLGPGGVALKVGGAILGAGGAEAGRQAAEGTPLEKPAQLAGAVVGGLGAAKALGPSAPKAAIPTSDELFSAAKSGYKEALASGVEVKSPALSSWATQIEQQLIGPEHGFTGGKGGIAPKTFGLIAALQRAPDNAVATAANLASIRKNLGHIASETQPANGGAVKPTPDAAAASIALKRFNELVEDLPEGSVVAGDAKNYVRATQQANANYAAGQRTRDFDARLTKAENQADQQVAGSLDSKIKQKAGQLLDNPKLTRGLSKEEVAQLQLINSGDAFSNTLRQMGRGGAGFGPLGAHAIVAASLAPSTGGMNIPVQAALAALLYGARKGSEGITKSRANKLAELMAMRSPEYERRVASLPSTDSSAGPGAVLRALLNTE